MTAVVALNAGSQGPKPIWQAAAVDDFEQAGNVRADAFAFIHRPHAEFGQEHLNPF